MRRRLIVLASALLPAVAVAGPAVDLLREPTTTIAVSSTVDNAKIVPAHLIDGKLQTAWNSRTGDLVGAWIAVRVPKAARVTSIKMSAGFTHVDKHGDLFTMNPRIRKVRVTRDGTVLGEHVLDIERRTLQELPVDAGGGTFKIEVIEIVAGTRTAWKEISVSELEVWGTPGSGGNRARGKPTVRVGSLDGPPPFPTTQCTKLIFPDAERGRIDAAKDAEVIERVEAISLGDTLVACRIDHAEPRDPADPRDRDTTTVVALVKRAPKPRMIGEERTFTATNRNGGDGDGARGTVRVSAFPLTLSEAGLLVEVSESTQSPGWDTGIETSTLYRATRSGFTAVLAFSSTWSSGEADDADRCKLESPTLGPKMPQLTLECTTTEGRWHGQDPRGNGTFESFRTTHHRWNGTVYVKR
ncbi:MAG: hypothetical protein SFX73_01760 [Kofleriaceae bacterium]|nr:hypothetical protein [Kofleriaceae bacterium]